MKIERSNNPKQAHRYGVKLDGLPRSVRQFLIENRSLNEWAGDMQFLEQIVRIELKNLRLKNNTKRNKLYYDWTTDSTVPMDELVDSYWLVPAAFVLSCPSIVFVVVQLYLSINRGTDTLRRGALPPSSDAAIGWIGHLWQKRSPWSRIRLAPYCEQPPLLSLVLTKMMYPHPWKSLIELLARVH